MKISKNAFSRFDISSIPDPIGFSGYHGRFGNVIGRLLRIFHKTVALETKTGTYYLNCISWAKWYQRVTGWQGDTNFIALQARNPQWVKEKIKEVIQKKSVEVQARELPRADKAQQNDRFVQAVRDGNFEECQNLFKEVDVKTLPNFDSLLDLAFQNKSKGDRFKVGIFLIEHGADINKRDSEDVLLLEKVLRQRDAEAMVWLVRHGVNVTLKPSPASKCQTFMEYIEIVQWEDLIEKSAFKRLLNVNHSLESIEYLIDKKNKNLLESIESGNIDKCKDLIDKGINLNPNLKDQTTPLLTALRRAHKLKHQMNRFDICQLLLENGANINNNDFVGTYPIELAISYLDKEMIEWLIKRGADLKTKTLTNNDSLFEFAMFQTFFQKADYNLKRDIYELLLPGKVEYIQEILKQENLLDQFIDIFMYQENWDIEKLKKLIAEGIDFSKSFDKESYLFKFHKWLENDINNQAIEIFEILLNNGARETIDQKKSDKTLLETAIILNQANLVLLLAKHGADTKFLTKDGKTYLELAKELKIDENDPEWDRNQQEILEILQHPEKILKV